LRDVPVLVDMLTYDFGTPEGKLLKAPRTMQHSTIYDPPIDEFSVLRTQLSKGESESVKLSGPQVLIATEGSGKLVADKEYELKPGFVYYIFPNTQFAISADGSLVTYTAVCQA
ncbi:Mannose-6-phosphate isomerase, partial [Linderina pennispora]